MKTIIKSKNAIRLEAFNFLQKFGPKIREKLNNICAKTGQYFVPSELYQKRTPRNNRVLLQWSSVRNNNLTLEQLQTFEGGVVIEFLNNDYFDESNKQFPIFEELKNRIGSNDTVSAIISIRSEGGSSSSSIPRMAFNKLINNTTIKYNGSQIILNKENYEDYSIKQLASGGTGNEKWSGFLFVSIRGGQQDTIETHHGLELTIFNPACEYASEDVRIDIDLVVSYFMMKSIDYNSLCTADQSKYDTIFSKISDTLKGIYYNHSDYSGNLLDYCVNHPSVKMFKNQLTDPIQLEKISIENFNIDNRASTSIDLTHNEAVNLDKYYWDSVKNCLLSPARPTNIFWSFHLSNMMQQDYSLTDYFEYEKMRYEKRLKLL